MSQPGDVIGFSVFELFEECYEYVGNECFIAGSREQAEVYRRDAGLNAADARIDEVRCSDLLEDFGVSGGRHAMETEAFTRFQAAAQAAGVRFETRTDVLFDGLVFVSIDPAQVHPREDW